MTGSMIARLVLHKRFGSITRSCQDIIASSFCRSTQTHNFGSRPAAHQFLSTTNDPRIKLLLPSRINTWKIINSSPSLWTTKEKKYVSELMMVLAVALSSLVSSMSINNIPSSSTSITNCDMVEDDFGAIFTTEEFEDDESNENEDPSTQDGYVDSTNLKSITGDTTNLRQERIKDEIVEHTAAKQIMEERNIHHVMTVDEAIDQYVKNLMEDDRLIRLPMGLGYVPPPSFEFGMYKALVYKAKDLFQTTIESWNDPKIQTELVGHTIVYNYLPISTSIMGGNGNVKNGDSAVTARTPVTFLKHHGVGPPFEILDQIADILMNDERFWNYDTKRLLPLEFQRAFIVNALHILGCITVDLIFSTSVTIHSGLFEMNWTYHPELLTKHLAAQNPKETISNLLEQIDFDEVELHAIQAAKEYGTDYPGEASLYSICFKLMLIMFLMMNIDAESRAVGGCVRMELKKPTR